MNTRNRTRSVLTLVALSAMALLSLGSQAQAASIFTDGFNAVPGNQNNTQGTTTFALQVGANYDNWGITTSVGHQVDLNTANAGMVTGNPENLPNPNNWAAMLLFNQQLLSNANIAANGSGVQYSVDFFAGPADYAGGQGSATANGSGLRIELIDNNGAGSVIGTTDFTAVDFASLASNLDLGLSNGNFTYTGSGNGDVKIRITGLGSGVFNGSIDSISISDQVIPEPNSLVLAALGLVGLMAIRRRRRNRR